MSSRSGCGVGRVAFVVVVAGSGSTIRAATTPPTPPALDYTDQKSSDPVAPTFMRSAIVTTVGGNIRDDQFADMVSKNVVNYNELAFAFMECMGGGMIDELAAKGFTNAVFQSAARHNQQAWAIEGDAGTVQSCYNWAYAPKAGSNAPVSQKDAAIFARANDYTGVLRPNTQIPAAVTDREDPQYLSTGATGDAVTLHRKSAGNVNKVDNTKYLSILYGGANSNQNDVNSNDRSLKTMQDQMTAAGYVGQEVRTLWTDNAVGRRPTFVDTAQAWKDIGAFSNATTQILFWANWGHGTCFEDKIAKDKFKKGQVPKKGLSFNSEFNDSATALSFFGNLTKTYTFYSEQGSPALLPYFEVYSTLPVSGLSVSINGFSLSPGDTNIQDVYADGSRLEYEYKFGISQAAFSSITSGDSTFLIDYVSGGSANGDLDFLMAGLSLGDGVNGVMVPEPGGCVLFSLGLLALVRHRERDRG